MATCKPQPPVNLTKLKARHALMCSQKIRYGLGAKAVPLSIEPEKIRLIDCSGDVRYLLDYATDGQLILPDGSQNQREWCEQMHAAGLMHKVEHYSDLGPHTTKVRLFICFIKPFENGCGSVGHVWLVALINGKVMTLESHSGKGCDSRPFDVDVLKREVYSVYELKTVEGI